MGDSEPVVAHTSAMDYPSVGYASTDYSATDPTAATDAGAYTIGTSGDLTSATAPTETVYALPDGTSLGDGNVYNMDPNSVPQEGLLAQNYEAKPPVGATDSSENFVQETSATESTHAVGYESTNGNDIDMRNFTLAGNAENGNVSNNDGGSVVEQQFEEGSGI